MKYPVLLSLFILCLFSCKQKKKEPEKKYVSVLSLVKAQVAHIDTSLYAIVKIVSTDSLHQDTAYIRREDFAAEAREFLEIPDLSDKKIARRFKEETLYDNSINRVVITYTPENPDKEIIQKQELLVVPDPLLGDRVTNIIITSSVSNRDSSVQKNMLWQMDKSFQVVTTRRLPGQPETVTTTQVTWNEGFDQ
ncbi:MAG: hypothetical protein HZB42_09090 [Sphingobacteriales bacterium]|nr:hypothetical protein [Sphingobacteriales bacterium]